MSEIRIDPASVHTISADRLGPAPLIFVQDPHYVNETKTPPDPWCLSCGARLAPKGLPVHARWHGWNPENYEVASHDELARRGL